MKPGASLKACGTLGKHVSLSKSLWASHNTREPLGKPAFEKMGMCGMILQHPTGDNYSENVKLQHRPHRIQINHDS